jgi:hypothetical protein
MGVELSGRESVRAHAFFKLSRSTALMAISRFPNSIYPDSKLAPGRVIYDAVLVSASLQVRTSHNSSVNSMSVDLTSGCFPITRRDRKAEACVKDGSEVESR